MFLPSTITRTLLLLSLFPMHCTVADGTKSTNAPEAQEDNLGSPAGTTLPDDDALGGTFDLNEFEDSSSIAEKNSDTVPGSMLQFGTDDDPEPLPNAGSANVNCNSDIESSSYQPLTPQRRRLTKRQSKELCPLVPTVPTTTEQQQEEGDSESPSSSPNYPKIPDIIFPGRVGPGHTRTTRKSNSLNDRNALMLLYLYPGFDGRSNTAVCNRDRDHQVPICAPFLAARLSPAEIVKPCRFCEFFYPSFPFLGAFEHFPFTRGD